MAAIADPYTSSNAHTGAKLGNEQWPYSDSLNTYPEYNPLPKNASAATQESPDRYHTADEGPGTPSRHGSRKTSGHVKSALRPRHHGGSTTSSEDTSATDATSVDDSDSKWIHRDKLARIESQELAEIGLQLGLQSRSGSGPRSRSLSRKGSLKRTVPQEGQIYTSDEPLPNGDDANASSPSLTRIDQEAMPTSQSFEEEANIQQLPRRTLSKPTTIRTAVSRIPVSKSSPMNGSISLGISPGSALERTRKTSIKNARDSMDSTMSQKFRFSSTSFADSLADQPSSGSNIRTEEVTGSPVSSPPGSLRVRKSTSVSGRRRPSRGGRVIQGQRAVSAKQESSRSRREINRPEGEAPWIATMFKPDPMLPQDQQMLPTIAKKMAMEQGKFPPSAAPSTDATFEPKTPPRQSETSDATAKGPHQQASSPQGRPSSETRPSFRNLLIKESFKLRKSQESIRRATTEDSPKAPEPQWPLKNGNVPDAPPQIHMPSTLDQDPFLGRQSDQHAYIGGYNLIPVVQRPVELQPKPSYKSLKADLVLAAPQAMSSTHLSATASPVAQTPAQDSEVPASEISPNARTSALSPPAETFTAPRPVRAVPRVTQIPDTLEAPAKQERACAGCCAVM